MTTSLGVLQKARPSDLMKSSIPGWNNGGRGHDKAVNERMSFIKGAPGKLFNSSRITIKLSLKTSKSAVIYACMIVSRPAELSPEPTESKPDNIVLSDPANSFMVWP